MFQHKVVLNTLIFQLLRQQSSHTIIIFIPFLKRNLAISHSIFAQKRANLYLATRFSGSDSPGQRQENYPTSHQLHQCCSSVTFPSRSDDIHEALQQPASCEHTQICVRNSVAVSVQILHSQHHESRTFDNASVATSNNLADWFGNFSGTQMLFDWRLDIQYATSCNLYVSHDRGMHHIESIPFQILWV